MLVDPLDPVMGRELIYSAAVILERIYVRQSVVYGIDLCYQQIFQESHVNAAADLPVLPGVGNGHLDPPVIGLFGYGINPAATPAEHHSAGVSVD